MPNLTGDCGFSEGMRNRDGLAELPASNWLFHLLGKNGVRVNMEAPMVAADRQKNTLSKRPYVDFRGGALMEAVNIAHRDGGLAFASAQKDTLCARKNLSRMTAGMVAACAVYEGLALNKQLQAGNHR